MWSLVDTWWLCAPCWRPRLTPAIGCKKAAQCMHWLKQHKWPILWAARWVSGTRGMDEVFQGAGLQVHLGRHHEGRLPSDSTPGGRSLRCPAKLSEAPCLGEDNTTLRSSLRQRLPGTSPQELPFGSGRWPLLLAMQPGAQGSPEEFSFSQQHQQTPFNQQKKPNAGAQTTCLPHTVFSGRSWSSRCI